MNINSLRQISDLCFDAQTIARQLGISLASARVTAARYVEREHLVRLKANLFVLRERWDRLTRVEQFRLANRLQVPSYVSLTSALAYYEISTVIQPAFVESVATRRTRTFPVVDMTFRYCKLAADLYAGFVKRDDMFIALPEKAVLDCLYLERQNAYTLDRTAINWERLDQEQLLLWAQVFPTTVRKEIRSIYAAAT
jgi:predicted transcriptional regulator of viral defense system